MHLKSHNKMHTSHTTIIFTIFPFAFVTLNDDAVHMAMDTAPSLTLYLPRNYSTFFFPMIATIHEFISFETLQTLLQI